MDFELDWLMVFAFIFDSVGGGEWLVLLAVILIVVGPRNLPAAARKVGKVMGQLRRAADEFKRQLMTMDQEVRSTVDDVKQSYITAAEETKNDVAAAVSDNPDQDRAEYEDPFNGDNPYPGHGVDSVYNDEDSGVMYPDGTFVADNAQSDAVSETGVSESTPEPKEKSDLTAVKITVSPLKKGSA